MVSDRHSGRGSVGGLGEISTLDPSLGVLQSIEIAGRQRGDRLGPDQHPGVFDHAEHLCDAVVYFAQQPALCRYLSAAKGQLAGTRALDTHLLLEIGRENPIAFTAELPGFKIKMELRYDKQRQALGAWTTYRPDALRSGEDEMDDVLG